MSAVFSGYPNVLTIHGNMRRIAKVQRHAYNWLAARLESLALPRSLGTVCLTSHTQRHVRDLARRTWIVPNAVDPSFFDIAAQPDLSVPRVLCVGTVCRLKNQLGLIHALDDIAQSFKFKLLFLGGADQADSYFGEFRTAVRDREWCEYAGFADRETLKSQLRQAALLVLPSLEENCPMVILEAMASGVPVVGARVGGIPDLIEEDKTGFFCDPLDPVSTRSAVEAALGDPPRLAVIAKTAKYRARERFHPSVIARRHLEIYREVLA
jgi:glycosyltransferase involved in cell wall biosynthesis